MTKSSLERIPRGFLRICKRCGELNIEVAFGPDWGLNQPTGTEPQTFNGQIISEVGY